MDNNYHEKRASKRRQEDFQLEFLIKVCKLGSRLQHLDNVKTLLKDAMDNIENWDKSMKREAI